MQRQHMAISSLMVRRTYSLQEMTSQNKCLDRFLSLMIEIRKSRRDGKWR